MIARISILSEQGTLYSYLDGSTYFDGLLPVSWKEEDDSTPDLVVGVLETIAQSDLVPPFLSYEAVVAVTIEEEDDKSWVGKKFA